MKNTRLVFCSLNERVGEYIPVQFDNFLPRVGEIVTLNRKKYEVKLIEHNPGQGIYFYVLEVDFNQLRKSVFYGISLT